MTVFCKACGYRVTKKSRCVWCSNQQDTLEQLSVECIDVMNARYRALPRKTKTTYIIAMGLEGFTPDEICVMTDESTESIEKLLMQAEVCREPK